MYVSLLRLFLYILDLRNVLYVMYVSLFIYLDLRNISSDCNVSNLFRGTNIFPSPPPTVAFQIGLDSHIKTSTFQIRYLTLCFVCGISNLLYPGIGV